MATVYGSDNSETINFFDGVTNGADTIFGYGGADDIFGLGGNDEIKGGGGADTLNGGSGTDTANYSDSAAGVVVSLISGAGNGGTAEGDELVSIENLTGSAHDDFLVGNDGKNVLTGLEDADVLKGGGGNDTLYGDSGNDTLKGGGGEDVLNGGSGIDTAAYNESSAGVFISLFNDTAAYGDAEGDELNSIENVTGSTKVDNLWGNDGTNVLKGMNGNDNLKGFGGNDTLLGGNQNDKLYGMIGVDSLNGEAGNDTLDGGAGADTMTGGTGNDTFIVDNAGDTVTEVASGGIDTVKSALSYTLSAEVETLRTTNDAGTGAINLTGNGVNNYVVGNAGVNVIDGKGGVDTMQGLGGNDTYYVDSAGEAIVEAASAGTDTVRATVDHQLTAGQEIEALTTTDNNGVGAINLTGNVYAQTMVGNAGFNVLQGLAGDDYLQGRAGLDTLTGGAGSDKFLFNTALNAATNVDTITDMTAGVDTIRLDDAVFAGIGPVGVLNADAFHIGAAAADAQDRIVYNSATGQVFFDSNGNAAGGSTLFANLSTGLALSNTDFIVV